MENKQKYVIYWGWALVLLLIIAVASYFLTPSKNETPVEEELQQEQTATETQTDNDKLCKEQYWVNAVEWTPWHCACKEWYERNNWRTRCVRSRNTNSQTNGITNKYQKRDDNTFFWEWFEGEDDVNLIPLGHGETWQKFIENSYVGKNDPDYKYKEGEEIIMEALQDRGKVTPIREENDEDYLWEIINDINSKKRFTENNENTNTTTKKQEGTKNITTEKESTIIETFIGSIETKPTTEGIIYYYTFTDPSFWTTPVRIGFLSRIKITNSDITTDIGWAGVNINKLKFHWWITNAEVTKDFWITRCWPFEPEWYVFNPGKNTFSLKWSSEEGFTYINYFKWKIYPVFSFPWTELSQWNKNCMVEIGRKENFSKFPFELKWSFENAVVAITKNKDTSSNCSALLWNHDNTIVIYNEELACEIWYNNWTSLREITTK